MMLADVGAVVVHHRNFPAVLETVDLIVAAGVAPENFVLVDNSEDPVLNASLEAQLPAAVTLITVANSGYGAAVNEGVRQLQALRAGLPFILVSSHETRPHDSALALLRDALVDRSDAVVAGPTLVTESDDGERLIFSEGGMHSRFFNQPEHLTHLAPLSELKTGAPEVRDWLDGSFCLYRAEAFQGHEIDESFFLYYEETDFHARLRAAGWTALWVPSAVVEQSTSGMPPRLIGRNLQIYQQRYGTLLSRVVTVPKFILRQSVRKVLKGGREHERRQLVAGWWSAVRDSGLER